MKKEYISPAMRTQRIKLQQMIAESPATSFTPNGESGQGKLLDSDASGTGLGRRGSSLWDDEE